MGYIKTGMSFVCYDRVKQVQLFLDFYITESDIKYTHYTKRCSGKLELYVAPIVT